MIVPSTKQDSTQEVGNNERTKLDAISTMKIPLSVDLSEAEIFRDLETENASVATRFNYHTVQYCNYQQGHGVAKLLVRRAAG
ncbi:hypothetical protein B7463_g1734, partial [Scytalidium lignicola]